MPTKLKVAFNEDGTGVVNAQFYDEKDEPVVPVSINWALTDSSGNVINNRDEVSVSPPAQEIDILLTGDDLQPGNLYVTVWGTYDSDLGNGLPYKDWCNFKVRDAPI